MTLTRRLNQFVKEVATVATNGLEDDKDSIFGECVEEYTDQVVSDDYYFVVNYANNNGIKIPVALRGAIDPAY